MHNSNYTSFIFHSGVIKSYFMSYSANIIKIILHCVCINYIKNVDFRSIKMTYSASSV